MAVKTKYTLITKRAQEADQELQTIASGGNWKPILMSSTATESGIWLSIVFENVSES